MWSHHGQIRLIFSSPTTAFEALHADGDLCYHAATIDIGHFGHAFCWLAGIIICTNVLPGYSRGEGSGLSLWDLNRARLEVRNACVKK